MAQSLSISPKSFKQQPEQCIFCVPEDQLSPNNSGSTLFFMMNQALNSKHSSSQSANSQVLPIQILLKIQDPCTPEQALQYCQYKQYQCLDQQDQNLRRWYKQVQFNKKIDMLSEYYKFHKDIPRIISKDIQKVLGKYYDRKRQCDYKYLKKKLKEEQGLSITSVQSSCTQNSESIQKKSRYSTLLNLLQEDPNQSERNKMSDSNLLQDICQEIGNALPKVRVGDGDFEGFFFDSEKKSFENYVRKSQANLKKTKNHKRPQIQTINVHSFKKKKFIKENQKAPQNNYFNLNKNIIFNKDADQKTVSTKIRNDTIKINSNKKRTFERSHGNQKSEKMERSDEKRKFIYNTNVKIEIKNALFQLGPYDPPSNDKFGKSRKSLVGKITALNEDKYRTPVSKIYQAQQQDQSRYRKKSNTIRKQRLLTRQSRQIQNRASQSSIRRVFSSHGLPKRSLEPKNLPITSKDRHFNARTVSVGKLKIENQGRELKIRPIVSVASDKNIGLKNQFNNFNDNNRRKSINSSHNTNLNYRQLSGDKNQITKYSSSELKDVSRSKGVSIKDLLTKKLNIYERV